MGTKRFLTIAVLVVLLLPLEGNSQVMRIPPFSGTNYLNLAIQGDTLGTGARRDTNAVYELQRGGIYLSNAVIRNVGWTLRIKANDTTAGVAKPTVYLYGATLPGQFVDMRGDVIIRNIIIAGCVDTDPLEMAKMQGALFNTTAPGKSLTLDSCLLTTTNGNHVRTDQAPHNIKITNCIFANMGYLGRSNLGAGKALDVRGGSIDTLIMVNNTFVNWQDRIVRHFLSTANLKYFRFEHNTCVNGMSYHGFLSLGRVGTEIIIRDNLLVDAFALGADTDAVRQAEFNDTGELDAFGYPRMTWVMSVPNDSTQWTVRNNFYRITQRGQDFLDSASLIPIIANPPLTIGSPLTHHISAKIGIDSATAFLAHTAVMPNTPNLMNEMMKWYRRPFVGGFPDSGANKTKLTGMFKKAYDYDRRTTVYFRDSLNCAYSAGNPVYTSATNGYPAGDLNWFPALKTRWELGLVADIPVGNGLPELFALNQNYPNPFNPTTKISFVLPKQDRATLEVFDILGRSVVTLVNGVTTAGEHTVELNAAKLGTGVYFYRLSTPTQTLTRKMMLVK